MGFRGGWNEVGRTTAAGRSEGRKMGAESMDVEVTGVSRSCERSG